MASDPHFDSQRIVVAVGAIVQGDDGRYLLVKHTPERKGFWQDRWIFPGGKLETGEGVVSGIEREVKEETGLDIVVGRANPWAERIERDGELVPLHVLYFTHMARAVGGHLTPGSDVGEARWVSVTEMRQVWPEMHEDTQTIATLAGIA